MGTCMVSITHAQISYRLHYYKHSNTGYTAHDTSKRIQPCTNTKDHIHKYIIAQIQYKLNDALKNTRLNTNMMKMPESLKSYAHELCNGETSKREANGGFAGEMKRKGEGKGDVFGVGVKGEEEALGLGFFGVMVMERELWPALVMGRV